MTGFGSSKLESANFNVNIQVKSVNGRFLEVRFRLPREYASLEVELKKNLTKSMQRGTVEVSVHRTSSGALGSQNAEVIPNIGLAKSWMKASKAFAKELNLKSTLSIDTLMRVPDMVLVPGETELASEEKEHVVKVFSEALEACALERKREGRAQFKIFTDLLDQLSDIIKTVEGKKSTIDVQLRAKLAEKLKILGSGEFEVDPSRLAQEVLFLLEKADIAEEIIRAKTHLKAYRKALEETSATGKKLEFYTQELHREFNTMGAKTQALEITLNVVEAKAVLERMREQVQNVE